jgi:hypothetical protein
MNQQLAFSFVDDIDEELRHEAEYLERIRELEHERDHGKFMLERYPVRPEELELWLLSGIRPGRFVRDAECHECNFDYFNHCPEIFCAAQRSRYGGIYHVCIRDYFGKCVEWGILPPEYPEVHAQIKASIQRAQRIKSARLATNSEVK